MILKISFVFAMILKMILRFSYVRMDFQNQANGTRRIAMLFACMCTEAHWRCTHPYSTILMVIRISLVFAMILKMILRISYVRMEIQN